MGDPPISIFNCSGFDPSDPALAGDIAPVTMYVPPLPTGTVYFHEAPVVMALSVSTVMVLKFMGVNVADVSVVATEQ